MSIPSTSCAFMTSTTAMSNIEFDIKLVQDEIMMLTQMSNQAQGDTQLLQQYHIRNVELEQQLKQLETEYQAVKARMESEEKMRKEAVTRGFKLNV